MDYANDVAGRLYRHREVSWALREQPEDERMQIKIVGQENPTHWLRATPGEVRVIREVLAGASIAEIVAACEAEGFRR